MWGAEELRWRVRELLVPGDDPVGEPGRRPDFRIVEGGLEAALSLFDQLKEMGEVENVASYNGRLVRLSSKCARAPSWAEELPRTPYFYELR